MHPIDRIMHAGLLLLFLATGSLAKGDSRLAQDTVASAIQSTIPTNLDEEGLDREASEAEALRLRVTSLEARIEQLEARILALTERLERAFPEVTEAPEESEEAGLEHMYAD